MRFVVIWSYDNYIPAHLAMGRLKQEGIQSWLKDENTVTIDPLLANAVGGIKVMVEEKQAQKAWDVLNQALEDHKRHFACPQCKSHNIQLVTSPRKPRNWLSAIASFFLGDFAIGADKTYHCFNCSAEFQSPLYLNDHLENSENQS